MLAVLFHRLGPYHHARLEALAERLPVTAIEMTSVDRTYAWDTESGSGKFPIATLFADGDVHDKRPAEIQPRLRQTLDALRPGVVAIPGWSDPAALAALGWCAETGTPALLMSASTARDEPRVWWRERIKSRLVRQFAGAVVGGAPQAAYVISLGMAPERVWRGYDVVDNAHFARGAETARVSPSALRARHRLPDRFFLTCGRFVVKKNLSRLIDAFARYHAAGGAWGLVLVGDGPLRAELEVYAEQLGLSECVRFPGFQQYRELPGFYGLADAFILASTTEQWGLVVNEALAAGLPVLVSERCGCAPDLVVDGVNGWLFDPEDIDALAGLLHRVSAADADLDAIGRAGRRLVADWSPATFADAMARAVLAVQAERGLQRGALDRSLIRLAMRR